MQEGGSEKQAAARGQFPLDRISRMASSTILSATFFGATRYFPLSTLPLIPMTRLDRSISFPLKIEPFGPPLPRPLCAKMEDPPMTVFPAGPRPSREVSSGGTRNFTGTRKNAFHAGRGDDVKSR